MLDDTPAGVRTGSVQTMMQLPVIDELSTMCIDEAPVKLTGYPKGGQFTGPGVNSDTGEFSPAVAGPGIHNVVYTRDGCEALIQVSVLPDVMVVTHQSDAIQTRCNSQKIPIAFESDEGSENYMWYYRISEDDHFVKYDSMKQVIVGNTAGFYKVVVSRGSCTPRSAEFEIIDEPEVLINVAPVTTICTEEEIVLSFTPKNGIWAGEGISADGVFNPKQTGNGSYKQIYTVTTPAGCIWKDSIMLHVDLIKPPELLYGGEAICGDNHIALLLTDVDDGSTVTWFKNGAPTIWSGNKTLDVFDEGRYSAEVSKGTCVLSTQEVFVPKEVVDIVFNIPVLCADELVMLEVTPLGGTWRGEVVTESGQFDTSLIPDGNYPVQYDLYTAVGCHWQKSIEVVVDKLKEPDLASDAEVVCRDQPATISLINVDDRSVILWHNEGTPNFEGGSNIHLSVEKPGVYWATVMKSNCVLSTEKITLAARPDSLFVPNVFTPNSDNANDYFEVRSEGLNDFHLSLFNRYGMSMYETDKIDFTWSGDGASTGIYFWRVTYLSCAETREEQKGWLHIIK
jgi:gliding motility-associated-like protein